VSSQACSGLTHSCHLFQSYLLSWCLSGLRSITSFIFISTAILTKYISNFCLCIYVLFLYRCTVHSEVYLIHTHQLMHFYILFKKFKFYIKTLETLLHVSILRSSSGSTYSSLLELYIKTISDLLRYINFGDVAACRVFVCASYTVQRTTHIQTHDLLRMIVGSKLVGAF